MAGICLIVGVQALAGIGRASAGADRDRRGRPSATPAAAIFGRGFKGLDPMAPAAGSLLCGAAILSRSASWSTGRGRWRRRRVRCWRCSALAVFSTALAFVIYFRLIQTLGSVGTTAQAYLRVPIGVALGVVFLGETLSPTAWIGLGLRRRRRRRDDDPASGRAARGLMTIPDADETACPCCMAA